MLQNDSGYWGMDLHCDPDDTEAVQDIKQIHTILLKHKIDVGGYDSSPYPPEIVEDKGQLRLYLGR